MGSIEPRVALIFWTQSGLRVLVDPAGNDPGLEQFSWSVPINGCSV